MFNGLYNGINELKKLGRSVFKCVCQHTFQHISMFQIFIFKMEQQLDLLVKPLGPAINLNS